MLKIKNLSRLDGKLGGKNHLNFEIKNQECVVVMGESGAGKSLFLRAIADIDEANGEFFLNETERNQIKASDWRKKITYVSAESGWWNDMVHSHFKFPEKALEVAISLGLPANIMEWQVSRLSTGEKQRLALARAMSINPSILVLDEPTSALDTTATQKTEDLLKEFLKQDKAIIMSSHNHEQAKRMANRIIIIENGEIKEEIKNA